MAVIDVERTAEPAPAPRALASWWDLAVRVALLLVLLVGVGAALPSRLAQTRPIGQFLVDLRADRVTAIRHQNGSGELLWSDGWLHWYQGDLDQALPSPGRSRDGMDPGDYNGDIDDVASSWVLHALDATGHDGLDYRVVDSSDQLSWAKQVPWKGLSLAAETATLLAFVLMLSRMHRRFGTRWAWFWVFALAGVAAPILYLALEPLPVWRGGATRRAFPARPAFRGGTGFLVGLLLKAAIGILGATLFS